MDNKSKEIVFQNEMIEQLVANGWLLGSPERYNRELALYPDDLLGFVQDTQDTEWQKYRKLYPNNPEQKFLERVANQLNNANPNAANKVSRLKKNGVDLVKNGYVYKNSFFMHIPSYMYKKWIFLYM